MSADVLEQIIARAMVDSHFRDDLKRDAKMTLTDYGLGDDELDALFRGDEEKLKELGVRDELAHAARTGIEKVTLS